MTGAETAAPMEIGPGLSPAASSSATSPVVSSALMSVSAQLRGLVSMNGLRGVAFDAAVPGAAERASGYAVRKLNRSVIGCAG